MTIQEKVILIATLSLSLIVVAMLSMFCYAIIDPNTPDEEVFTIIGPSFQVIVGGFIGLVTGIKIGKIKSEPDV
jgi:hypothetical protein